MLKNIKEETRQNKVMMILVLLILAAGLYFILPKISVLYNPDNSSIYFLMAMIIMSGVVNFAYRIKDKVMLFFTLYALMFVAFHLNPSVEAIESLKALSLSMFNILMIMLISEINMTEYNNRFVIFMIILSFIDGFVRITLEVSSIFRGTNGDTALYFATGYYIMLTLFMVWIIFKVRFRNIYSRFHVHFFNIFVLISGAMAAYDYNGFYQGNFDIISLANICIIGFILISKYFTYTRDYFRLTFSHEKQKRMMSNIAHDLKEPLGAIRGYMELLLDENENTAEDIEYYSNALKENLEEITSRINNLQVIAKVEEMPLVKSKVNANEFFEQILALFSKKASGQKISLVFDPCPDGFTLNIDERRFRIVMENLVSNALKNTNSGDIISIRCYEKRSNTVIVVSDTGSGMGKEEMPRIFDRYFSKKTGDKDSGLGLAIVKQIVEEHDGKIKVISHPNFGSNFIITL
ncbi:MAG: HAMP domain-containing histidine kinase [Eubacteriaceae bacterium]|nr:HAMP domain-containing histidine kinase [Eubacteriaceae bacterium]